MKNLLIVAALVLSSSSAFARFCHVEMVDNRTNRVIDNFLDRDDDCAEAMRECKTEIRLRGLTRGAADCYLRQRTSRPDPRPNPIPNPYPSPRPQPLPDTNPYPMPSPDSGYDARRPLAAGEIVIVSSRRVTVIGGNFNGHYSVRDDYGFITNNVRRENIAVTRGCNITLCVNEKIINSGRELTIVGLGFDDTFVAQDSYGFMTSNIRFDNIARMTGCLSLGYYSQVCVGNQVINRYGQYQTVVAIQPDGRVVLKDSYGFITSNVDPKDLVITR